MGDVSEAAIPRPDAMELELVRRAERLDNPEFRVWLEEGRRSAASELIGARTEADVLQMIEAYERP